MKRIYVYGLLAAMIWACKPDVTERNIGDPYDLTEGINGSWEVSKVQVTDLSLPVPEQRDISEYYLGQSQLLGIDFNSEDNSYTVQNAALPGSPFGAGGTYRFQINEQGFTTGLQMVTSSGQDTLNLNLLNMVRSIDPVMGFSDTRSACGESYASYQYTFKRK
ncbi:MAG: DUF5004 domain-containing protein [Owenweeksia sp.]